MGVIVFIGDSLIMPRPAENISPEETYGYMASQELKDHQVIITAKYSNDTAIQSQIKNLKAIKRASPHVVFVQLGIVDCAPRLFSKREKTLINKLPPSFRNWLIGILSGKRRELTKWFPKVYVKRKDFKRNMEIILDFVEECGAVPVIIIIAKTSEENNARSYNFLKNIRDYNAVLRELAQEKGRALIDLYHLVDEDPACLLPDGIHLSKKGSCNLTKEIVRCANRIMEEQSKRKEQRGANGDC
jgi:lysophospholipase L1-like esterase